MDSEFYRQLLDISRRMSETREVQPLLEYAMKQALELLNAEQGYLVLVDEQNRLDFRVRINRDGHLLDHPESQISHSILTRVVRHREPVFVTDAIMDPTFKVSDSVKQLQLRSVMAVPLRTASEILGAIYVENRQRSHIFDDHKLELLNFFASQATVAIENALLNENLERKVQTRTAELQAAMMQAEQAWQHAVEANRLRTMVLSNVAHDLRSPVALAVTVLRTLREGNYGDLNDDQLRWINRALQSLDHAVNLTRDVFDLAKAEEAGRLEVYLKKRWI
jgi:transcriptional regulator with GAF, ATPase, and Fis domain